MYLVSASNKKIEFGLFIVLITTLLAGCGSGGGGGGGSTAPAISNLQYVPQAAYVSTTETLFTGSVSFSDADGDLSSTTLTIVDSNGAIVSTTTTPIQGGSGQTVGTIQGTVNALLPVADNYTVEVYVTDAQGHQSNVLSGPVRIAQFPWTSKQASSIGRQYSAVAVLNGKLYVVGGQRTDTGITPGPVTAVMEIYDPQTNTWTPAPDMPTARMGLVAAVVSGKLYAIGGTVNRIGGVGTVEEFDPVSQTWAAKASMPSPRYFAAGAQVGGRIFVIGGTSSSASSGGLNITEAYDPATDSWSSVATLPTARKELAAAESGGLIYAVGGYAGLIPQWVGAVEVYDPTSNSWSSLTPMPTARSHLALVAVAGKVLAAGGENVLRALDILESYDVTTNTWSVKTPSPTGFTRAGAGVVNDKIYVLGNGLAWEYDLANEIR